MTQERQITQERTDDTGETFETDKTLIFKTYKFNSTHIFAIHTLSPRDTRDTFAARNTLTTTTTTTNKSDVQNTS